MAVDMFGTEAPAPQGGRKTTQPRGYAWRPGTGPAGETCKSCAFITRLRQAKTYLKCGKNAAKWTHGPGSDIKARSPACKFWEPVKAPSDPARSGLPNPGVQSMWSRG